ncbi:Crp/Fnr family transcriptional regulator [Paenibacillus sp. UNC499MF]|uniref:Crp/Fnr family transcriptional regulator n=1 Tax=Paenibacillus sp. UNC499MF TaxID=1502751 RepID=UPI00089FAC7D|nr:Crp/Fnr family transcriptional regulator [Paenibacillus sp. UNC499MF]SEG24812.1 cAMP-binding domain of CRP or a regulatory subunit of cAMP-dependent protein kinases [Paenibacillus sp. UNC499MF]
MKQILHKYLTRYTSLNEEQRQAVLEEIPVKEYKKGTVLLKQGDVPTACFFVLKGCVRQFSIDEAGRETTTNFYTEEQAVAIFNHHKPDKSSEYTFTCLEDCAVVVGRLEIEQDMYARHTQLESMTRRMIEQNLGQVQEEFAAFIASTPEERFRALEIKRPDLIGRVPQHQLASYLGMTPESLSRIKNRVKRDKI